MSVTKSTQCWCERTLSGRFSPLFAPLPLNLFLQHPLTAPLPLTPFSARSAPFSAPLTLRSHALVKTHLVATSFSRLCAMQNANHLICHVKKNSQHFLGVEPVNPREIWPCSSCIICFLQSCVNVLVLMILMILSVKLPARINNCEQNLQLRDTRTKHNSVYRCWW